MYFYHIFFVYAILYHQADKFAKLNDKFAKQSAKLQKPRFRVRSTGPARH